MVRVSALAYILPEALGARHLSYLTLIRDIYNLKADAGGTLDPWSQQPTLATPDMYRRAICMGVNNSVKSACLEPTGIDDSVDLPFPCIKSWLLIIRNLGYSSPPSLAGERAPDFRWSPPPPPQRHP